MRENRRNGKSRRGPPPNTSPHNRSKCILPSTIPPKTSGYYNNTYYTRVSSSFSADQLWARIIVLVLKSYYVCDVYYNMFIMITSSSFCVAKWIQFTGDGTSAAQLCKLQCIYRIVSYIPPGYYGDLMSRAHRR